MRSERTRDRFMPWAGLALGTLGAGFDHQLGAASTFQDCTVGSPLIVVIGTLAGLTLIAAGAVLSWRVSSSDAEPPARRMIAAVSLLACGLYTMAVLLPLFASLVIPRCWA